MKMKLGKMKMPDDKKPPMHELDMEQAGDDHDSELPDMANGDQDDESSESPDDEKKEDAGSADSLKDASDDDLLAEVKKRGLMGELDSGAPGAGPSADDEEKNEQDYSM